MLTDTKKSPYAQVYGLKFNDVEWTAGFYNECFSTCAEAMVPHLQSMFESKDISHVLENFRIAAGEEAGDFDGTVFGDGDFYKWMEAAVYTAVRTKNQDLLDKLDEYIKIIGKAQQPDGYLSTKQIIGERQGVLSRLSDINDFEVYNFGHLFTSACLHLRLTGKDSFLRIAEKAAGYLKQLYEKSERNGEVQTAVCPSHYMGLAELYRTTGNREYLILLKKAVALRDSVKEGLDDNQDRLPLRRHEKIIGHAVRANYLYAGVADLCLEERDEELVEVLHKVWKSLVTKKLYITGGCGALYNGASPYGNFFDHQLVHQAYGYEYQLPNITAYNETCASIGGVYWAWRMFCLEKKAEYADVLERMILNVNLAAVSIDGKRYFYENMLRRTKNLPYELVWGQERTEYILSYCCPPNLARMMAQMSEYLYAFSVEEEDSRDEVNASSGIYTVLYGASRAGIKLPATEFTLVQETEYPYDGEVIFRFEEVKKNGAFILNLRIPSWVREGHVKLFSKESGHIQIIYKLSRKDAGTYVKVLVEEPESMEVHLSLPMKARLTCAHPMVEEAAGQAAVERGPLVYCMEGMDCQAETLDDIMIPADIDLQTEVFEIKGRKLLSLKGTLLLRKTDQYDREALYHDYAEQGYEKIQARMIPYFAWDNRGMDEMRIWFPVLSAAGKGY